MKLAALLLLTLFGIHYLNDTVASTYATPQQPYAAKAWEYIFTAVGGCIVLALLGLCARSWHVWPVILFGMVEGGERAVCRLARPIGDGAPLVKIFSGLCGVQFYWLGLIAGGILAVSMLDKLRKKRHGLDR
jgi:hypothetical protein